MDDKAVQLELALAELGLIVDELFDNATTAQKDLAGREAEVLAVIRNSIVNYLNMSVLITVFGPVEGLKMSAAMSGAATMPPEVEALLGGDGSPYVAPEDEWN